ncbi:2fff91e4-6fe9-4a8e-a36c-e83118e1dc8e [Sclerotinia trifoliorum]|uniref:2fff91e4-6fe9-4a8e-a36c-e83118e1dc8e n=1 Tax=Sclerotinia trifoliorum TaxID=28548 RepID=A0A8H2W550_9HELO|nr:2fff91e4-6fe9-4a8e-a36c-e83118e1dc8e [Sclerotinia trifoliorum]
MRPDVLSFSLDEQGFMIQEHNTKLSWEKFVNREKVEEVYVPEIEALLRQIDPSIDRVYFLDSRHRSSELATETKEGRIDMNNLTSLLHPARAVHVDQSPAAVLHRVELQLPNEAEFLLRGRVRVIKCAKASKT